MATIQAQRAINGLKAAGYKRDEFQVRTERKVSWWDGKACYTYGNAAIIVFAPLARQLELAEKVAEQGIGVLVYYQGERNFYPHYEADAKNPCVKRVELGKGDSQS